MTNKTASQAADNIELVGRAAELHAVAELLDAVTSGRGQLLAIEADAGVGKTALLDLAAQQARHRGIRTLHAAGAALEAQLSWGIVRQLFGRRLRDWSDSADLLAWSMPPQATPPFATFDGLYWLLAELADDGPVLLVIDDTHWTDEPSRRWLDYISRRLIDLPVGVLLAGRPRREPLLSADSRGRTLTLPVLPRADVEQWLRRDLAAEPATGFLDEFYRLTGGNALLVSELLRAARAEGAATDDTGAPALPDLAPRGVETSVRHRLAVLGPPETAVAVALAVLGAADVDTVARVAGQPRPVIDGALVRMQNDGLVVRDGDTLRFTHPLIHAAVQRGLPQSDLDRAHAAAAAILHADGAEPEQVSAHLVRTAGPLEPWAVAALLDAAEQAETNESPAAARAYLERAVEIGTCDIETRLRLARVTSVVDPPVGLTLLETLLDEQSDTEVRARIAVELARTQRLFGRAGDATRVLIATRAALSAESRLVERVDAELLVCASTSRSARATLGSWRQAVPDDPGASGPHRMRLLTATRALNSAHDGGSRAEIRHAVAVVLDGLDSVPAPLSGVIKSLAGQALMLVDDAEPAQSILDSLVDTTRDPGMAAHHAGMLAQRASLGLRRGHLADALADAQTALALAEATRSYHAMLPRATAAVITVATQQRATVPVHWISSELDSDNITNRLVAHARADLLYEQANFIAAAEAFERCGELNLELGWRGVTTPWRSRLALCLARLGQVDRALGLIDDELQIARASDVPSAIGVALHAGVSVDRLTGRSRVDPLEQLRAADDLLRSSPCLVEHSQLLADLGEALWAADEAAAARTTLHEAWTIADRCDALVLRGRLATRLREVGGRPTTPSRVLTRAEKTVAGHAAEGLTNRQIARTLFVTEKTVEAHLRAAFRKLGVRSRAELPDRLG